MKIHYFAGLSIFILCACSSGTNLPKTHAVELSIQTPVVSNRTLNQTILIPTVVLRNTTARPIRIIFAGVFMDNIILKYELSDAAGMKINETPIKPVNTLRSPRMREQLLNPNETIACKTWPETNLQITYPLLNPGRYRLMVHVEITESPPRGNGVLQEFSSDPLEFLVE